MHYRCDRRPSIQCTADIGQRRVFPAADLLRQEEGQECYDFFLEERNFQSYDGRYFAIRSVWRALRDANYTESVRIYGHP